MSQTISSKNRLSEFEKTDFFAPQPYQKVMRVYAKDKNGSLRAQITSYHPNGQIKQYLEAVDQRALGTYCEWYANGQKKVHAYVISGIADLNSQAETSWLFDGYTYAWDDEGHFIAKIPYALGELEGEALYYHPNGNLWKQLSHSKGVLHGLSSIYLEDGTAFQTTNYEHGEKHGICYRYWSPDQLAYEEHYNQGRLEEGCYLSAQGNLLAEVKNGEGTRAVFSKTSLAELQHYKNGWQEGLVKMLDAKGNIACSYHLKNTLKHGEELGYYPGTQQPKIQLTWNMGVLQGSIKTWYEDGVLESQREMSQNQKNGLLTAWYRNSSLMLVEDYENDKLIKGEYYRMAEHVPVSKVENGKGLATLFSADGTFAKKVHYSEGRPVE
ncbi:MAG: hypothetical protein JSR97_09005 [Verrucomicrobia bacterium]|nr:hypothetical protein [Verrucomicrobiota bacterium]